MYIAPASASGSSPPEMQECESAVAEPFLFGRSVIDGVATNEEHRWVSSLLMSTIDADELMDAFQAGDDLLFWKFNKFLKRKN